MKGLIDGRYYVVDRLEGTVFVLVDEEDNLIKVETSEFPKKTKEGDYFKYHSGKFGFDAEKTKAMKRKAQNLLIRLLGKS